MEDQAARFLRVCRENIGHGRAGHAEAGRVEQGQLFQPVAIARGKLSSQPAPERETGHIGLVKPDLVHQIRIVKDQVFYGVYLLQALRTAKARVAGYIHRIMLRELFKKR